MASYELACPGTEPRGARAPAAVWRRSAASAANGNCVELAPVPTGWLVRDSKHTGPRLRFTPAAWAALLSRAGRLPGRSP